MYSNTNVFTTVCFKYLRISEEWVPKLIPGLLSPVRLRGLNYSLRDILSRAQWKLYEMGKAERFYTIEKN